MPFVFKWQNSFENTTNVHIYFLCENIDLLQNSTTVNATNYGQRACKIGQNTLAVFHIFVSIHHKTFDFIFVVKLGCF